MPGRKADDLKSQELNEAGVRRSTRPLSSADDPPYIAGEPPVDALGHRRSVLSAARHTFTRPSTLVVHVMHARA